MKIKVYVKRFKGEDGIPFVNLPQFIDKGEWVDLRCARTTRLKAPQSGVLKSRKSGGDVERYRNVSFDSCMIPLGIAMKLPKGYEAHVLPRSSTFKGMGIILANSQGVIDSSYSGDNDEWKYPAIALRDTTVNLNERICQFRITLSQKASFWDKLKWLLSSGVELVEVDKLSSNDRGGFGSTGKE